MGETFCWEHIAWVPIGTTGILSVAVDGHSTTVQLRGVERPQIIPVSTLRAAFARIPLDEVAMPAPTRALRRLARQQDVAEEFRDAWLFQDRLTEADDSAEHLYRWVRRHHPEINAFFVLNGDAPDWDRLADDGFRLITANAPEHAAALVNAAYLISSHADVYVHDRLPRHHFSDMRRFRFVFLQHGVIKDDISLWLNGKPIDCFVTSTPEEFEFVSGDGPFVFSRKEVVLTGLPRHDALLQAPRDDERTMVIMPTWRLSLENGAPEGQGKRTNDALLASHYCRRWKALLHSARLRHIAKATGYRIVFIPHKKIEPDLDAFEIPKGIDVIRFGDFPISPFFAATSLFVTDYSSKAFDVALLNKPVMYYQFDPEVFFEGGHWSRPGYFSYERDGFGPVFTEEHGLVAAIEAFMTGTPADPVYQGRAARTFPFRDGKCCERVFNAILDLERPYADTAPADSPAHVVQARRPAVTGTGRTW